MVLFDSYANGFDEELGKTPPPSAQCPECSSALATQSGETACVDCGLVIEACRIDRGPEWRSFPDDDSDPERTGAPLTETRHDRGLSTEIGRRADGSGSILSSEKRAQLTRLRREHNRGRFQTKRDKNLAHACTEIDRLCGALEAPESVAERACLLFRQAQDADLLRGRSIEALAAGSVYAAVRCGDCTRTIAEIVAVAQVSRGKVRLGYDVFNVELGLPTPPPSPLEFLPSLASVLDVPESVRRRSRELAEEAIDAGIANGRQPSGVAAACLYQAARERGLTLTQQAVAEAADTTSVTVRARWEELPD